MSPVLSVRNLTKQYHSSSLAVDAISFGLKKKEILGFLGPNGSGKTTTIQMLLGALLPTSGVIEYFGKDFAKHRTELLQHITFASTYLSMPYILTVEENLDVMGLLYGLAKKESRRRYLPLLERFGIAKYLNARVASLSAGQVTRLMMVKAFFSKPKVVLLDEPTASLDPDVANEICRFLIEQKEEEETSIIFTSHKMDEVALVCDRVIFLDQGKIIADDVPQALARKTGNFRLRLVLVEGISRAIAIADEEKLTYTQDNRFFTIEMPEEKIPRYLHALSHGGVLYSGIQIQEPSLEDYFLKIARKKHRG
jgi:ABC-2 type transport system ATP-binding protein